RFIIPSPVTHRIDTTAPSLRRTVVGAGGAVSSSTSPARRKSFIHRKTRGIPMIKLGTLALTLALTLSSSAYACELHGTDALHGHSTIKTLHDAGNEHSWAVDEHAWLSEDDAATVDLAAATETLASQLTDDEYVIEV